jgi:hypothetical protein
VAIVMLACDAPGPSGSQELEDTGRVDLGWGVSEVVRIGMAEGQQEYMFNRIADMAVDDEGHVYVLDQGDRVIRSYDATGNHRVTFGGHGGGPGEFEVPLGIAVSGDSVVVYDALHQRLAIFDRNGTVVGTIPVELSPLVHGFPQRMQRVDGGWTVVLATGCRVPRPEDPRPRWRLALIDEVGAVQVVADEADEGQLAVYAEGGCTSLSALARPTPSVAFDVEGLMYRGDGGRYEIEIFEVRSVAADRAALPIRVVGRQTFSRDVTPEEIRDYEQMWLEEEHIQADPSRRTSVSSAWDSLGYPERWPYFEELHVDRQRHLWVGRPPIPDGGIRDWDLFSPEGAYLGSVELPSDLEVIEIVGPMIWGLTRDEFDLEYVIGLEVGLRVN